MESRQRYTLTDVYNAARFERNFNYVFWMHITLDILGANMMKYAGYSLVLFATLLIAGISVLGFFVVLPTLFSVSSFYMYSHAVWGVFLVFSIYFNYFMAVFTKPGSPKDSLTLSRNSLPDDKEAQCSSSAASSYAGHLCKRCNYVKPQRTHHCSICNSCVLKMDHHCPWVSNCVGHRNYRYFVSFLFWTTLATAYVSIISGVLVFRKGSLLFPTGGRRSPGQIMVHTFLGTSESNIYSTLYNVLSGKAKKRGEGKRKRSSAGGVDFTKHFQQQQAQDRSSKEQEGVEGELHALAAEATTVTRKLFGEYVLLERFHSTEKGNLGTTEPVAERVLSEATDTVNTDSTADHLESEEFSHVHQQRMQHHYHARQAKRGIADPSALSVLSLLPPPDILIFIAFMASIGVCIGTGSLLTLHIYLISRGYTTIEFFESDSIIKHCKNAGVPYKHAYDRGVARNFAEVFGPGPWYLALLPSLRPPSAATSEVAYDSDEEASFPSSASYGSTQPPPQQQRAHRPRGNESNGISSGKGLGETGVVRRPLWEHNHPAQHSSTGSGSSIATTAATTMKHCECDSSNDRNAKCEV